MGLDVDMDDVFERTERNRLLAADLFASLDDEQWRTPSLCAGWTVREVASRLLMPLELSFQTILLRFGTERGSLARTNDESSRALAARPTEEIVVRYAIVPVRVLHRLSWGLWAHSRTRACICGTRRGHSRWTYRRRCRTGGWRWVPRVGQGALRVRAEGAARRLVIARQRSGVELRRGCGRRRPQRGSGHGRLGPPRRAR